MARRLLYLQPRQRLEHSLGFSFMQCMPVPGQAHGWKLPAHLSGRAAQNRAHFHRVVNAAHYNAARARLHDTAICTWLVCTYEALWCHE